MPTLIKSGRLLDPKSSTDKICDILIHDGKVMKIGEDIIADCERVIDAKGFWIMPGLIDVHCHLRDPGFEYKETVVTGAKSAAIGGFTTICAMPNTNPPTDNELVVNYILDKPAVINVLPVGAITKNMAGDELTDIDNLVKSGVCAVSEDGKTVESPILMEKAMLKAKDNNIPVFCHCEDKALSNNGVMNEGEAAQRLGLRPISDASEEAIIERDLMLANKTGAKVHICHVSTKGGVEMLRKAKANLKNITAEVCPHHFTLTDKEITKQGANAKMAPPLRDFDDLNELKNGLKDGTIDIIATDHAPHSEEEKGRGINDAPFGVVGFETALSLAITNLVNGELLTPLELAEKMSYNPAKLLGIDKGCIEEGKIADIVVVDPNYGYRVDINEFESKSKNSPFNGYELKGKVFANICTGNIIVYNYKGVWNDN